MKPLISVIIPCYNISEYLPDCLSSLEAQTIGMENLEIILVNDASPDNGKTWEKIVLFEQKHPENVIAVNLEENLKQGGARNVGIKYSNADFIAFVDGDDWIEADMYEKLWAAVQKYDCEAAECRLVAYDTKRPKTEPDIVQIQEKNAIEGGKWITSYSSICTKIYKKSLIIEHNIWFPEHLKYEDNYWEHILLLYIKRFCTIGDYLYHYQPNEFSTTQQRNAAHYFDRLKIEVMLLDKYKELGVFERFYHKIEIEFLRRFYTNTLYILVSKFDHPSYEIFCEMTHTVQTLFPHYAENPYLLSAENQVIKDSLQFVPMNLSEKEFEGITPILKHMK